MSISDQNVGTTESTEEIDLLRARARQMGVSHHPSIGLEKLREKIKAKMDEGRIMKTPEMSEREAMIKKRNKQVKEANRLIRIRVTNMNPNKRDWEGEIYTVGNSVVGSFKKYVPFNAEEGWHVPMIIYNHLLERKCQVFHTVKAAGGNKTRKGKLINELSIEVMPPLKRNEMKDLATQQAMRAGNQSEY